MFCKLINIAPYTISVTLLRFILPSCMMERQHIFLSMFLAGSLPPGPWRDIPWEQKGASCGLQEPKGLAGWPGACFSFLLLSAIVKSFEQNFEAVFSSLFAAVSYSSYKGDRMQNISLSMS